MLVKVNFIPMALLFGALFVSACELRENDLADSDDSRDRNITVVNDSSRTILGIRARNETTGQWTVNILGGNALHSRKSVELTLDDGSGACVFTLRTSYQRGYNNVTDRTYNVCEFAQLIYE